MPLPEPIYAKTPLTVADLRAARDKLLQIRFSGIAATDYERGGRAEYKSDLQLASAISALDGEIARRSGMPTSTLLVSASKGV
jgi:hypothetical protein